jgi:polyhydroxybutyrate depolymerase
MRPAIARAHRTAGAIVLAALLAVACSSDDAVGPVPDPVPGPGDFTRVLAFDGRTRSYLLHVPPGIGSNASPPLVLAFHGVPSGPQEIRSITGFDPLADQEGFVVAYPQAVDDWWTGCANCNSSAFLLNIDDVGFVRALIRQLEVDVGIDSRRVYAAGFSNGALFAQRLACDAAGQIAAFASVAATALEPDAIPACEPDARVPIVFFHGSLDPSFPPDGRTFGDGPTEVSTLSIGETLAAWVERNGCQSATPERTDLPDVEPDGTTAARKTWSGCGRGDLTFYEITGGGHTWPSSAVDFNDFLGPDSHDVPASEVIVDFFLSHVL